MEILVLYLATGILFLGLDAIGLSQIIRPLFERNLNEVLLDDFRIAPAALFYLFYVAVLVYLVSLPALPGEGYGAVAVQAALIGAVAYGTYEFTNLATLRPWHWTMVAVDLTWGTLLTTASVCGGLWITRAIFYG